LEAKFAVVIDFTLVKIHFVVALVVAADVVDAVVVVVPSGQGLHRSLCAAASASTCA
jgi:hypothetical protein